MAIQPIQLKLADASQGHAEFLAWVMLAASRAHNLEQSIWDFYVGGSEGECLRWLTALATTSQPSWCHYSRFIIAEVDGRPAAALCGYFEKDHESLLAGTAEADRMVGRTEQDAAAGWQRAGSIAFCGADHVPGAWIIENVATLPDYRRRGLVDRLLAEMITRGRDLRATVCDIGVFIGNYPAQGAYEKAGFRVIGEKLHPEFEAAYKCPGIRFLRQSI